MAVIEPIKVGVVANDRTGDPLRDAMQKANRNFAALNAALDDVFKSAPLPSGGDLNTVTTPGAYHQNTNSGAAAGLNYPTPYAGLLLVYASATNFLYQFYTRFRSGPSGAQATYWRTFYGNVWSDWQEVAKKSEVDALASAVASVQTVANAAIPIVQKAAANGVASLDGSGRLPLAQAPIVTATALPTTAHDLNTYTTPGPYWQNQSTAATLENNYPIAGVTCFLEVTTFGSATKQEISTRVSPYRNFWRIKTGTTSWSDWKESVDNTTGLAYQGGMPSSPAQDLNNYTQRGQWVVGSSTIAAAGLNFPIAHSGNLLVLSGGYVGGPAATTGCTQIYFAANSNRVFHRSLVNAVWSQWEEVMRSSLLGSANGVATLDAAGKIPQGQIPGVTATPLGVADDLNNFDVPGTYSMNSNATALLSLNYPVLLAGILTVETSSGGNLQVTQTYVTNPRENPRTFRRIRFAATKIWGSWFELARVDQAMTHTFLTTATDANTLTADNTFYTWTASSALGANFPSFSTAWAAAGYMRVYYGASTQVSQELTYLVTGQKPRTFMRFGNSSSGVWQPWKSTSAWHAATGLPTSDMGDIYVDGEGWYRWNGTAYGRSDLSYQSIADMHASIFGRGQAWQTVTASRIPGTTYTNSTSRPILVAVSATLSAADGGFIFTLDGGTVGRPTWTASFVGGTVAFFMIVPPGSTYVVGTSSVSSLAWREYR